MSGHSKWATTKHKKAILDSRRAKSFAKLIKNIEVAARMGGPDLAGNPGLELAVTKAKKLILQDKVHFFVGGLLASTGYAPIGLPATYAIITVMLASGQLLEARGSRTRKYQRDRQPHRKDSHLRRGC